MKQRRRKGEKPQTNKTGYRGVHYEPRIRKFIANIRFEGRYCYLGRFTTAKAASKVYLAAKGEIKNGTYTYVPKQTRKEPEKNCELCGITLRGQGKRCAPCKRAITLTDLPKTEAKYGELLKWLFDLDKHLAGVFAQLKPCQMLRTARGIIRHVKACRKNETQIDRDAIREIVLDGKTGKFIFEENEFDSQTKVPIEPRNYFEVYQTIYD